MLVIAVMMKMHSPVELISLLSKPGPCGVSRYVVRRKIGHIVFQRDEKHTATSYRVKRFTRISLISHTHFF
jgi:hypothetical protein